MWARPNDFIVVMIGNTNMKKLCSEPDCFQLVDLVWEGVKNSDGSYYPPSLKCWNYRTENDRKNIKRKRKEANKLINR